MLTLAYFPTLLWFLGFLEFHIQILFFGPTQHATGVSVYLSLLCALFFAIKKYPNIRADFNKIRSEVISAPIWFWLLLVITILIVLMGGFESRLPPHLIQERDAINYHMTIPYQHLLQGSLAHLKWSVADLWPMSIQFGLTPAWTMTRHFQKFPQYIFSVWSLWLAISLGRRLYPHSYLGWIPALAVFTTHGVSMWFGNATLELVNFYFLLAFVHSFFISPWIAALHLALFATAKVINIFFVGFSCVMITTFYFFTQKELLYLFIKKNIRIFLIAFVFALILLSRSMWVSLERVGTPVFPFAPCLFSSFPGCQGPLLKESLYAAELMVRARDGFGVATAGRNLTGFLTHLWKVSVPDWGSTTNEFVHPLGMAWVLWVILAFAHLWGWIKKKQALGFYFILAISFWGIWWLGSQQARWLIPTLFLGWLGTSHLQKKIHPLLLGILITASASFSLISLVRAYGWAQNDPSVRLLATSEEIEAQEKSKLVWDPKTGYITSEEILYVSEPVIHHGSRQRVWFFEN